MNRPVDTTPLDTALRVAITEAGGMLRFDNEPGSLARQDALGSLVAYLSGRLLQDFPQSAAALHAVVFRPPTTGNPTEPNPQHTEQHA